MAVSKTELIDDLKAHGLYQTAKFVESGFLLPSDLIFYKRTIPITEKDSSGDDKTTVYTQYPLADSFEKHLKHEAQKENINSDLKNQNNTEEITNTNNNIKWYIRVYEFIKKIFK